MSSSKLYETRHRPRPSIVDHACCMSYKTQRQREQMSSPSMVHRSSSRDIWVPHRRKYKPTFSIVALLFGSKSPRHRSLGPTHMDALNLKAYGLLGRYS